MSAAELWSNRRALTLAVICGLAVLTLSLLRTRWQLRFAHPSLDGLVVAAAAFSVPLLLGRLGDLLMRKPERWAAWAAAVVLALTLLPYGALALSHGLESLLPSGQDRTLLGEIRATDGVYRLYAIHCNATCPDGLALRKEKDLLLLKAVSTVWTASPEEPAELRPGSEGGVEVARGGYVLHTHRE